MSLDPGLKDAVKKLQSEAQQFRAILTVADAVDSIDKLEQLAGEADAALAAKRREVAAAEADLDKAKQRVAKASEAESAAKDRAEDIVAQARGKADTIVEKAEAEAEAIVARATDGATKAKTTADIELATVRADVAEAKNDLTDLGQRISTLTSEAADLEARAQKARDYLNSLAGKAA